MRFALLILALVLFPFAAQATEAPSGQIHIDAQKVLRGQFVALLQMKGATAPMQSTGHFVVAPGHGLIWNIEQPFPTSTVVTPNGATQNIGGMVMKLPAKNLRHLYEMVGGALAGDWSGLEQDYVLTPSGDEHHWHMLLVPRQTDKPKLSYARIMVSGGKFVENIAMVKADGTYDTFSFTDAALASTPLSAQESAVFQQAP
ncbi:MAG: outer membrane lipoprotein carrier protein LolA [Alphaproteobacteria bacterium]